MHAKPGASSLRVIGVVLFLAVWPWSALTQDDNAHNSQQNLVGESHNHHAEPCQPGAPHLECALQFKGLKSPEQYAHIARVRQESFCRDTAGMVMPGTIQVNATVASQKFVIHVYEGQDFVSNLIAQGQGWETHELTEVLWALTAPTPAQAEQAIAASAQPHLLLDIGANIGWFALAVAAHGYEVAAFEGMAANQRLIRTALCQQPQLMDRVTLYPFGLSAKRDVCYLAAATTNKGDGIAICGKPSWEAAQATLNGSIYNIMSEMKLMRLDHVFRRSAKVMKLDVEGFEPIVLDGAEGLLLQHPIPFAMVEYNTPLLNNTIKEEGPFGLVTRLRKLGYHQISTSSFQGPWVADEELQALGQKHTNINLYCVHDPNSPKAINIFPA